MSNFRLIGIVTIFMALHAPVSAAPEQVLHSFCIKGGDRCADGRNPRDLVMDGAGNLYGIALGGGRNDGGVAFELVPNHDKTNWTYKVLYSFCKLNDCADGIALEGPMILDTQGNLYGLTQWAGSSGGWGKLFKLSPSADGEWTNTILYEFCSGACADGATPVGGLAYAGAASGVPYDGESPLYTETKDNLKNDGGAVVEITPPLKKGDLWTARAIYSFCAKKDCKDGRIASFTSGIGEDGSLAMDGSGNLYGTTLRGGSKNSGVVFKLAPKGKRWTQSVLYNFCTQKGVGDNDCDDGGSPAANVILDGDGALLGTTDEGGRFGSGTLFRLSGSTYTKLHDFCAEHDCADGGNPEGILALDAQGRIFGTNSAGGLNGGTVFEFDGSQMHTLHMFCSKAGCADGKNPEAGVLVDGMGNLFGTTNDGGRKDGIGTAFMLKP